MNEAMGGGPDGLQTTIIQVGKALNDPIKGVGALRRVGVQLSEQQEEQIKTLVEQNDLYGAQQIILDELATQFGGRFAAAGDTAEGKMAALSDRVEDVQKALAGPLIPAIDRVRDRLIEFLGTDRVLIGAEKLGEAIAGLFTDENIDRGVGMVEGLIDKLTTGDFSGITAGISGIASEVSGLPWESIGNAAELLGTGAKALLDTFTSMPPWVQTAVLTAWGLNKLTGGALGGIVGELGKGLIKGVLNMNAGVVNVNAKTVTGGPGGGIGGGGKGPGKVGFGIGSLLALAGLPAAFGFGQQLAGGKPWWEQGPSKSDAGRPGSKSGVQKVEDPKVREVLNSKLPQFLQKTDQTLASQRQMIGATIGLGPRIDRVANTPHNVTANVDNFVNVTANVGVSVLGQQAYRTRTIYNRSSQSTNTAGY
jgi:hypothetical protein